MATGILPPTINSSGGVVASSPGSGTLGYVGNTVTINGTNLASVSIVKVGGSGGTPVTITGQSSTTLTFTAINQSGQIYVENPAGNTTSTETYTNLGYITTSTGGWSTTGTWLGSAVPPSSTSTNVTIAHDVTSTPTATVGQLSVNTGKILTITSGTGITVSINSTISGTITDNGTLATGATLTNSGSLNINGAFQINQGGFGTGAGTWSYGASSNLIFNHTSGTYGSIDVNHTYWPGSVGPVNVYVLNSSSGGINLGVSRTVSGIFQTAANVQGTALTFNGTCQINAGGSFSTAPNYGTSSLLIYNTGTTYGRSTEWSANSGAGWPNDIQISGGTSLNYPNTDANNTTNLSLQRDLTIDNGCALYMDYGLGTSSGSVTVGRNINIAGNLSLGDGSYGDLYVGGNWTHTGGSFVTWDRAVYFNGTGTQTITKSGGETFNYLVVNKSSGTLQLESNISINSNKNVLLLMEQVI
jgi:hypothetical protein